MQFNVRKENEGTVCFSVVSTDVYKNFQKVTIFDKTVCETMLHAAIITTAPTYCPYTTNSLRHVYFSQ